MQRGFFIILSCALLTLVGCGQKPHARQQPLESPLSLRQLFHVDLQWTKGPFAKNYSAATLTFTKPDGSAPTSVQDIDFDPQMPSMQHGTSTIDQVITPTADRAHVFTIEGIYLIMGGDWVINITANIDGNIDTASVPVSVP